jgi:hypothetical protein
MGHVPLPYFSRGSLNQVPQEVKEPAQQLRPSGSAWNFHGWDWWMSFFKLFPSFRLVSHQYVPFHLKMEHVEI